MTDARPAREHPIAILVNPASTAAHPGLVELAERLLGPLGLTVVLTTQERGHAAELATLAHQAHGALTVVTMGGDGTAAEAAGALVGTQAALAPIPAGSTNVFARTLGWPMDGEEALRLLAREIEQGMTAAPVTIGRLEADGERRYFIVNAGVGVEAEAAAMVEERPHMKKRMGQAWFGAATAAAAFKLRKGDGITVSIDGGTPFPVASLSVACSRPYAYFKRRPVDLVPDAGQEGQLGWLGATSGGMTPPALAAAGALTGAWHLDSSLMAHGSAEREIVVECPNGVALHADGEPLGHVHHVVLQPAPGLRVLRAS